MDHIYHDIVLICHFQENKIENKYEIVNNIIISYRI